MKTKRVFQVWAQVLVGHSITLDGFEGGYSVLQPIMGNEEFVQLLLDIQSAIIEHCPRTRTTSCETWVVNKSYRVTSIDFQVIETTILL